MICPQCGSRKRTKTFNTRPLEMGWWRRHRCHECGHRFTTVEVCVDDLNLPPRVGGRGPKADMSVRLLAAMAERSVT